MRKHPRQHPNWKIRRREINWEIVLPGNGSECVETNLPADFRICGRGTTNCEWRLIGKGRLVSNSHFTFVLLSWAFSLLNAVGCTSLSFFELNLIEACHLRTPLCLPEANLRLRNLLQLRSGLLPVLGYSFEEI